MKILDMIKMCLQNLTRRKSRTILTVLGVVVGCCAIVTMMSIGFGVPKSTSENSVPHMEPPHPSDRPLRRA